MIRDAIYDLVARNRYRCSAVVTLASCEFGSFVAIVNRPKLRDDGA